MGDGLLAGASVPQIGPLARTRMVALARRAGADDRLVGAALSFEGTLDEVSFVLGPALVGLAATLARPAVALALAAVLLAGCGSAFALHRTATALRPAKAPAKAPAGVRRARTRLPGGVWAMRASMALQGAMFGACQAGITALTAHLGRPAQAGLVYAAMGVMSAAAGLSLALVPARIGLPARWRAAGVALVALSAPLLCVRTLGALYLVVVVLGVAFAPHLITVFGLTERAVPASRLAESMAFLTSAVVGGQALALALSGRLADAYGPQAAFAVAVGAAALILAVAAATRPTAAARPVTRAVAAPADSAPSASADHRP